MFDRDNNGYITTKELNTIMKTLGFNPTEEDLQQIIFTVDYGGEQSMSLAELYIKYLKDITRWREDINFTFECQEQYLTSQSSE